MNLESEQFADTDLCVKCGLCLPHCPTYNKIKDENESPRGRIELIQAWAAQQLSASDKFFAHIDNCLLCRNCERVCPAKVPYGKLVDRFRARQAGKAGRSLMLKIIKTIAHNRQVSQYAKSALNAYRNSGLQKTAVLRMLGLGNIERLLSVAGNNGNAGQYRPLYPAVGAVRGDVGLFVGCMGRLLDGATIDAAIQVLNQSGFNVHVPKLQVCCGALDLHSGDAKTAGKLAAANVAAFSARPLTAIVTIASGCGAVMKEYPDRNFSAGIVDISRFLYETNAITALKLQPFKARVCIHSPCSLRNVMGEHDQVLQLIKQIPNIELTALPDRLACCGSAGSYMMEQPAMAKIILEDVLRAVDQLQPEYLLSSNIGCVLHIKAGLKENNIKAEVLHPVVLLNRVMSV